MKIVLVRHSKTLINSDISPNLWGLSEEGINLANTLAKEEVWNNIDVLYCSNQLKALETTLPIAKQNFIPIRTYEELTEITSFTIKTFAGDYKKYVEEFYTVPNTSYFGGETLESGLARFNKAIEEIATKEKGKNIAVISHNNILTVFMKQFSKDNYLAIHDNMPMPSYAILDWDSKIIERSFK